MLNQSTPFERGELEGFYAAPGTAPMDDLGFVEAVDRLGEGVVLAVANAADRRHETGFGTYWVDSIGRRNTQI